MTAYRPFLRPFLNAAPVLRHAGMAIMATAAGLGVLAAPARLAAEPQFTNLIENDMSRCAPGAGPAVRVEVSGIKSAQGLLIVRAYPASSSEWLKAKRYFAKIHEPARKGRMSVCVPVPKAGADYAIAVQHDVKGNYATNFTTDGAGMSNNPVVKTILGIPRSPPVDQVAFRVGEGVTRVAIEMRYMN
ncbi:MAG: DUF2141 domain-containing protein [Erythrobacter sp.]